jgi:poly(U)-specific endoribonuclease
VTPRRTDRRGFLGTLAALAALPALPARGAAAGIYQQIWDADQAGRGIRPIAAGARGDPDQGFVIVDEAAGSEAGHRLFAEVQIPEPKRLTYELCRRLFDNYRLDQTKPEDTTPEEARETLALLDAISDSLPMRAARRHLEQQRGRAYDDGAWQELIFEVWFRPFDDGRNRDLSGFEHVVVGEQRAGRVNGYHFWYKYYLDDGIGQAADAIEFDGLRYAGLAAIGPRLPEVVTLAFRWHAEDAEAGIRRALYKPVGGFFVGCSVEGLMALGLVRFFERGRVEATINRGRYELDLYRSPDGQSLRSSFPRLLGLG